jgi:hypothetical protein
VKCRYLERTILEVAGLNTPNDAPRAGMSSTASFEAVGDVYNAPAASPFSSSKSMY